MTVSLLEDAVELLVGAITALAGGIGAGANSMITSLIIGGTESAPALSVFGGTVFAFAGIALAIGLTTRLFTWLTSLGN